MTAASSPDTQARLEGKTALVTGGSGGLGAAFAVALAEAGANVGVHFRSRPDEARAVLDRVAALGRRAVPLQADTSDAASVAAMFERLDAELGPIDLLVNNAGIDGVRAPAWEVDPAAWRHTVEVNLFGAFHCAHEALRRMGRMVARRSGVVVNVSSVHEVIPWGGYSAYVASKAGLSMMSKSMALEAAEYGVRVLALAPGAVRTPINRDVWSDPAGLADLNKKVPRAASASPRRWPACWWPSPRMRGAISPAPPSSWTAA